MITDKQKQLIQQTIPLLKTDGVRLTKYFYQRMLKQIPELQETFNMGNQHNGHQAKALASVLLAYAENIENPHRLQPAIDLICHKHVSLNIQAPDYQIVGEHLLASISEVLGISMEDELIDAWSAAYHALAAVLINTEQALYAKQGETQGSWLGWRRFRLIRKVVETQEVTSFYLAAADNQPLPDYLAGQYISVRIPISSLGYNQTRQYTLSHASNGQFFRISVKEHRASSQHKPAGIVSSCLHHQLQIGDEVEVSAPTGNFTLTDPNKNIVLISAGIGITPMVALLEALNNATLTQGEVPNQPAATSAITVIHAARDPDSYALGHEIDALAAVNPRVKTFITYENVAAKNHPSGQLTITTLPPSLIPKDADYYLCGPHAFVHAIRHDLQQLAIPTRQIHAEVFTRDGATS